jgi:hypothetical protein
MNKLLAIVFVLLSYQLHGQTITTIAGTGTLGYNGDNSAAVSAQFNHPDVVKFDHSGNMFIADEHNHVVRKIN